MEISFNMPAGYEKEYRTDKIPQWRTISYPSGITNTERKASVLLPPDYTEEKKYPVVYLLHGIGGDENEWKQGGPEYIIANLLAEGRTKEFIAVLPNERVRQNDAANPADIFSIEHFQSFDRFREELFENLKPYVDAHFSTLTGRENTAIAGLSMGGREALYIALTKIEEFAYIGAFSPAFGLLEYENMNVHEAGLLGKKGFQIEDAYKADTRLMLVNGDHDDVVRDQPQLYHEALLENGTEHIYQITPGGHGFDVWSVGLYAFAQMVFR